MKKEDIKPAAWGAVGGAIALLIVAFATGWVVTSGSARDMAEQMSEKAVVASLAPICANKFEQAAKADTILIAALGAVDSWERDNDADCPACSKRRGSRMAANEARVVAHMMAPLDI
jgi:hypothetical protein